jgi:hypothetical protein
MRKEPLIAIFIGSAIGIVVAFSLWKFSTQKETTKAVQEITDGKSDLRKYDAGFSIVSPPNSSVSTDDIVKITGFSPANSIVISTGSEVGVALASSSGDFELEAGLSAGINEITVWSIKPDSSIENEKLSLIYSTKVPGDKEATSVSGTVTDIAEETVQIRKESGEIEQLSLNDETSYANLIDDEKEIEFGDIAIGDYITALGGINGEDVMEADRVLVSAAVLSSDYVVVAGELVTLSSSDFLVNSDGSEISIDAKGSVSVFNGSLETVRLSTAENGVKIIIVGIYEGDELVADTIILM